MTLLKNQCVSITDFRKHTIKYFELSKKHPIYVFSNNKLVGKIVDPWTVQWDDYNFTITFDPPKHAGELLAEIREDA